MSLKLLQKPELEPIRLDDIKSFLHLEHDLDDNLLNVLITTARELVEKFLGRSLITQKWQYQNRMDICAEPARPLNVAEVYPFGMNVNIALPNAPIIEVTNLMCNRVRVEEPDFKLTTVDGREVLSLQAKKCTGQSLDISAEYTAGYGDQAEDVPSTIRLAIMLVVGRIYKDRDLMSNGQENLLDGVKHLLCAYRINQDI
ncbi:MAG: head-tail connector protein [Holosporales bacterium]|nr:head-tail connector protein [Holosporales bacterium]